MNFKVIYIENNVGHGEARRKALCECSNSLVALMDADDISVSNRFEKQLRVFQEKPYLSIVGGQISEFEETPNNITGIRYVPRNHHDIANFMKKRCPMNQMSVMFKKEDIEEAGGYQDWYCEEDYYLWIRMMAQGYRFENVPDIIVNVRVGEAMSKRRGGWKYFRSEAKLQKYMLNTGVISLPRYLYNAALRFGGEVVISSKTRQKLYTFLRTKPTGKEDGRDEHIGKSTNKKIEDTAYPPFSVSMCVYGGDKARWFDMALESVINQTVIPSEIVLVVDGPIPLSIQAVIDKYKEICYRK